MKYTIFEESQINEASWAGGTTKQLYIYPENADYKAKNFEFRISTATVDLEESDFTVLSGVDRQIMSLDGEITLSHDGNNPTKLMPLEVHYFSGDVSTKSKGKCSDFNLMTTGSVKAEMASWSLSAEISATFIPHSDIQKIFLYAYKGQANIGIGGKTIQLKTGSFLAIDDVKSDEIILCADIETILATVYVHA